MKSFSLGNLKLRLTLLILFAVTPALVLHLISSREQMHIQQEGVREAALKLVRVMKSGHAQRIEDAQGMLKAMAQFFALREFGRQSCDVLRNELSQKFPGFTSIGLAAPNGDVLCTTGYAGVTGSIAEMPFFADTLTRRDIGIGPYEIEQGAAVPKVMLGVPLLGENKQIVAVMFAALMLSHFENLPPAAQLSRDSIVLVFDDAGLVLARYPDPQGWRGTNRIADAPMVRHIRNSLAEEGTEDLMGADGVSRMFAYARVHRTAAQKVYLATGVPVEVAYADARKGFFTDMLLLGIVFVVIWVIAAAGSHYLVVRKMQSLIGVAGRIRSGDLGARTGLTSTHDEIGQLAGAIDSMADAIQSRVAALQQHGAEMRELKEMNDALQACLTQDEVLAVVRQFALRLFPDQPGMLYLMHASGDYLEAKAHWGEPAAATEFLPQECWGVRRAKLYRVESDSRQPRCRHVYEPPPGDYVCVPLMVQGEMLGVLHLENDRLGHRSRDQPLVQAVAEHIALTVANLHLRDTLHAQAVRDGLTGLFNRRFMEESLRREMRNAQRNKSPVSIIMVDIDHFKRFNDTFGHAAGDLLLREVGNILQTQMRGGDLACRYGGEEFTIILPATMLHNAADIAEKLREKVRSLRLSMDGQQLSEITISLGVACYPEQGATWEDVLHAADLALMQAKQTRNRTVVHGAEDDASRPRQVGT